MSLLLQNDEEGYKKAGRHGNLARSRKMDEVRSLSEHHQKVFPVGHEVVLPSQRPLDKAGDGQGYGSGSLESRLGGDGCRKHLAVIVDLIEFMEPQP
jgi:hypothetical protein